jgi:putative hydrolase of the HAD superfamily
MFIFFDIDETLMDQRKAEAAAAAKWLAVYGNLLERRYSAAELCRVWRRLREKYAPLFLSGLISLREQRRRRIRELCGADRIYFSNAEADTIFDFYEYHYRKNWSLFEDVIPCLEALGGHRCGIISNGSSKQQNLKLHQTGIDRYFDVVVVSEDAGAAKPKREIFLTACRRAQTTPARCIYIGDRLDHDVLASRAIGMRSFWLHRGYVRSHPSIESIESLAELGPKLENKIAV